MPNLTHLFALAAAASLSAVAPAQAHPAQHVVVTGAPEMLTARVPIADLNLSSAAGRDRLDARLRAAVREVCPATAPMPLADVMRSQDCRKAARTDVGGQVARILAIRG
jgi:UrcA family protein